MKVFTLEQAILDAVAIRGRIDISKTRATKIARDCLKHVGKDAGKDEILDFVAKELLELENRPS